MFQYLAKSFMTVVQTTLSEIDSWNPDVSLAWEQLFQWITLGLESGYVVTKPADPAIISAASPTALTAASITASPQCTGTVTTSTTSSDAQE